MKVFAARHAARALLWAALVSLGGVARAEVPVPPLKARVTDLTATLSSEQRLALERKLAAFEARKGSQLAVLLLPTTQPETIEQYAIRVAEAWKLGRKGVDDGALLLVAKDDRRLRIEVGYGLEGALTDLASKRIVSDIVVPRLKQGDYPGGIDAGVEAMIKVIDGEPLPAPKPRSQAQPGVGFGDLENLLIVGFVVVMVVGGILRAIFGRFLGSGMVAAITGFIAWLLVGAAAIGVIVAIIAFAFSLFAGGMRGGYGPGGWGGGYSGGSWSTGGGGFGGGGGGFGGGGSSGSW